MKIKLAVIGCGKWGLNHVRTAYKILGKNLISVCDTDTSAQEKVQRISEKIKFTNNIRDITDNSEVNAVIVSSSAETHFDIAKECLLAGKNVLVEKPITLLSKEAVELVRISVEKNLKLMVGHVLLYHPALLTMKEKIDSGEIGKLQYIYSNRLNLGTIRSEENILWSFAPHDISIIQFLTGSVPEYIGAKGAAFVQQNIEDTTLTYMKYPGNVHAHIFVSWLHPFKEQRLVVIGDKGMLVFEDSLKTEKLKYYKKGFNIVNGEPEKFESEYEVITFPEKAPLEEEQMHFFDCIINDKTPRTDGVHAKEVLEVLETAQSRLNE
ncbi:MAG: Gfo/Idh/MocA family oxidoreductase [Ignavibacteriae bacterium]|nr:Gfo/Idh/MocA family oxidoreductase [Ignavibacteriota bacterium]